MTSDTLMLRDVLESLSYGYTASADNTNGNVKLLRITDIVNDIINWDLVPYCTADINSINEYQLDEGDIVIARTGGSVGRNAIIKNKVNAIFASYLIRLKIKKNLANPYYIYYILQTQAYKKYIKNTSKKSAQEGVNSQDILSFPISIPEDIQIQNKAVQLLSILDKKIEHNSKIISELESLTKTIYNYWFLQFDFPDENGKPYKSSGGKMVWNEELKREIPEGWQIKKISEIGYINRIMMSCDHVPKDSKYVGLEHIPRKRIILDSFGAIEDIMSDKLIAKENDILFGKIRPYFHKVSFTPYDVYCSSDTLIFNSYNPIDYAYLLYTLFSDSFVKYATKSSNLGSKMPRAEWNILKNYPLVYPESTQIIELFGTIVHPFLEKMKLMVKENHELSNLRDFILPMLMNSQIKFAT